MDTTLAAADWAPTGLSSGEFGTHLIGGDHDDELALLVRKANPADPIAITAVASGGNHHATATITPLASADPTCEVVNVVP